jgi:hypothetical protein
MKRMTYTFFILTWFISSPAISQIQFNYPARCAQVNSGIHHRGWTLERAGTKTKISETIFPLSATSQVTDNLSLVFFTSHAGAVLNSDQTLEGIADGKMKAFYQIIAHQLMVNLGCSLPYGKNKLTTTEFEVADYLFEQILGFGVNRFGEGLDLDVGLSGAVPVGPSANLGIGLGYLAKGEFEYLEATPQTYQPGNELSVSIGLDFNHDSLFVRGDILSKFYSRDKLTGDDFFQQGSQIEWSALAAFAAYPLRFSFLGRYLRKNENEFFQTTEFLPGAGANFIRNSASGQLNLYYHQRPLAIFGELGFSRFGESELQLGDASIFTSGGGIQFKFAEKILASLQLKYLFGTAQAGELTLRGWDGSLGIQIRF